MALYSRIIRYYCGLFQMTLWRKNNELKLLEFSTGHLILTFNDSKGNFSLEVTIINSLKKLL